MEEVYKKCGAILRRNIRLKRIKVIGAIFLIFTLIFAIYHIYLYNAPKQVHFHRVKSIALQEETLGGLRLMESITTLTPAPVPTNDNNLYDYYTMDHDMMVATRIGDDKIIRIIATSDNNMKTAKGIGRGNTRQDVRLAYGASYYIRGEQSATIMGYVDKNSHRCLEFWLQGDEVQMIRYDMDSIK